MRAIFAIVTLSLACPAAASSPIADVLCSRTQVLQERLTRQYQSERIATGLRNPEQIVEVWTDPQGEWIMVIRYSNGQSCIVAMGEYWQQIAEKAPS